MSRHSKEMIQRLENAGLGFYVKSTKTVHKIGNLTFACCYKCTFQFCHLCVYSECLFV